MNKTKYMREGRGACKICARELDVVVPLHPINPTKVAGVWGGHALVIARHLNRIEEYGPHGASPRGFCPGSLGEPDPIKVPEHAPGQRKRR